MVIKLTLKEAGIEEWGEMRPAVAHYIIPVTHNPHLPPTHKNPDWLAGLRWIGLGWKKSVCITLKGHHRCISIIKTTNYMETLAPPSLQLGRLKLGGFDIVPVATFPVLLSCVCVRLRRDDDVCSVVAHREGTTGRPGSRTVKEQTGTINPGLFCSYISSSAF